MGQFKLWALLFGAALTQSSAYAQPAEVELFTVQRLAESCRGIENGVQTEDHLLCVAYISGFDAGYGAAVGVGGARKLFCIDDRVNTQQRALVFLKWAGQNPERLHEIAEAGLLLALVTSFPCRAG